MTRITRRVALAGVLGSATALGIGARSGSRTDADRELGVEVVGDDEAYLRIVGEGERPLEAGARYASPHELTVGNLFDTPLDVHVAASAGDIAVDGETEQLLEGIKPGEERMVTLSGNGSGAVSDTIELTATGTEAGVVVDLERPVTLEREARKAAFHVRLCRGSGRPCVSMKILVLESKRHEALFTVLPTRKTRVSGPASTTRYSRRTLGLDKTETAIDLEFPLAGSSGSGLWNVTRAGPDPAPEPDETRPGESVSMSRRGVGLEVDPDAAGAKKTVSVTVDLAG